MFAADPAGMDAERLPTTTSPSGDQPADSPADRLEDRLDLAEAQLRASTGRADQLHALLAEARGCHRPDLAARAAAALAEHLLLHGDPSGVLVAVTALATVPDDLLVPPSLAQARARLRRVRLMATVLLDPSADHTAELRACLADFLRAGAHDDRWLTVTLFHATRIATAWTATAADRAALVEARDQLVAAGSPATPWARLGVAVVAHSLGHHDAARTELAALRAGPAPAAPLHVAALLDALRTLVDAAGPRADDALARLTDLADLVRREFPAASAGVLVTTTHALLDAGRATAAEEWLGRLGALPPAQPYEDAERAVMALRLDLLHGRGADDDVLGGVLAALESICAARRERVAGGLALRTAMTARAAGRDAVADALVARADSLLPAERNHWETWWAARSAATGAGDRPATGTGNRLTLLAPAAEAVLGGRRVPLAPAHARLLAVLACAARPLSTEALVDALWPDAEPVAGRRRLKSAHHRLRLLLGPDVDGLVRRERDVWSLVPEPAWSVDLAIFDRLAAGGPDERLAALRLPTGLLWNAQLPFDDVLTELRAPLEVRWLALAAGLVAEGAVTSQEVARLAAPLGLAVPDG